MALMALGCIAAMTTNPPATVPWGGSSSAAYNTVVTNDYSAVVTDYLILMKGTNKSVTLPSNGAGLADGKEYTVKSLSPEGTNTVIATAGLDGGTVFQLTAQYKYVRVRSDGTKFWVVGNGP